MKKCLEIAQKLENEVLNKIQKFANEAQVTSNYMNLILASQKNVVILLEQAAKQENSFPEYPDLNIEEIIFTQERWQEALDKILPDLEYQPQQLIELLMLDKANESLQEFYQQASANVPHPLSKLFLSSLAEVKNLQSMKISMFAKVYNNKLWGILGYAPFYNN